MKQMFIKNRLSPVNNCGFFVKDAFGLKFPMTRGWKIYFGNNLS